jgi:adenylosuccinate lyase
MATDIRLLSHEGELSELFGKTQVGSSAMPHKRNPIYSERICGIARFVMSLAQNPAQTTATQWLERTLDDSSNRRLAVPEAFLGADALLNLLSHMISSLVVSPQIASFHLKQQIPVLAMENILMAAANQGGDRQSLHENLRKLSAVAQKKKDPLHFLIATIEKDESFKLTRREITSLLSPESLLGRAPEQVNEFG